MRHPIADHAAGSAIVAKVNDTTEHSAGSDEWAARTVVAEYSPEHQFVGSLMWLTAAQARPLLDLVPSTAIAQPVARWAYELINQLVDVGTPPTPASVLAVGARHRARDAINATQPPSEGQHKKLALYLFDAYTHAIAPKAAIASHARWILDEAYRRAFDGCGARMQLLASSGADRDDLTKQFSAIGDELADLRRRAERATAQR